MVERQYKAFDKYEKYGPYHFRAFLPWPLKEVYAYSRYKNTKLVLLEFLKCRDEVLNVLDIGCGEGALEWFLQSEATKGYFVCADLSLKALNYAKLLLQTYNIDFVLTDAKNMPFRKNCFNVIIALEVIEHLDNPLMFLKKAYECLKEKGIVIISTPNALRKSRKDPYHYIEFTPRILKETCAKFFNYCKVYGLNSLKIFNFKTFLSFRVRILKLLLMALFWILDLVDLKVHARLSRKPITCVTLMCICRKQDGTKQNKKRSHRDTS